MPKTVVETRNINKISNARTPKHSAKLEVRSKRSNAPKKRESRALSKLFLNKKNSTPL